MYSPKIVERRQRKLEKSLAFKLHRYNSQEIEERVAYLNSLRGEDGKLLRQPTAPERDFIVNETLLSAIDFRHWATNYGYIKLDGGGLGLWKPWGSQEIVEQRIASLEEQQWEKKDKGEVVSGIRLMEHKARQLGLTMDARLHMVHGAIFDQHIGVLSASIGQGEIGELYDRDCLIYEHLPWWMKPEILFNVKNEQLSFAKLNTRMQYQESNQKSGVGIGRQFEKAHLTECAAWDVPDTIELDFFPTIPYSIKTLIILESTAQGRGNWWHEYTEAVRMGDHPEWEYIFIPWYSEPKKYRLTPPPNWKPTDISIAHAKRVEETSPQWMRGKTVRLDLEQLYFYERGYESARKGNTLNYFLTNYPAEPEEGFQHSIAGAFSFEELDKHQRTCLEPEYYEFVRDNKEKLKISPLEDVNPNDLRGVLCVWEKPERKATYVVGIDPTVGIEGWDRRIRRVGEGRTDNAVIEVIKIGRRGDPDRQVAEYAAPQTIPDFSPMCDFMGRWYAGNDETEAALMIPENHGINTTIFPELINRFQYPNIYVWKSLSGASYRTIYHGFQPTHESNKALFIKALDWLVKNRLVVRSHSLVGEFRDLTSNWITETVRHRHGRHDDRIKALFFAIWAAHDWNTLADLEAYEQDRSVSKPTKPWAMDVSLEQMNEMMEEEFASWMEE